MLHAVPRIPAGVWPGAFTADPRCGHLPRVSRGRAHGLRSEAGFGTGPARCRRIPGTGGNCAEAGMMARNSAFGAWSERAGEEATQPTAVPAPGWAGLAAVPPAQDMLSQLNVAGFKNMSRN